MSTIIIVKRIFYSFSMIAEHLFPSTLLGALNMLDERWKNERISFTSLFLYPIGSLGQWKIRVNLFNNNNNPACNVLELATLFQPII